MSDSSPAGEQAGHVQAAPRFVLGALCCGVFIVFTVLLAREASVDSLRPLRNVSFVLLGVCVNFAVCLGSALLFGIWVRRRRADARKP